MKTSILFNFKPNKPNKNKVIYPERELDKAFEKYSKEIEKKRSLGQIGQPLTSIIDFKKIAFIINKIDKIENQWVAEIETLETEEGNRLKNILNDIKNDNFRIVTNCFANLKEDGVVENLEIANTGIEKKENCA